MRSPAHPRLPTLILPLAAMLVVGLTSCSRRAMEPGGPLAPGLPAASNAPVVEEYAGSPTCVGCVGSAARLRLYGDGTYELEAPVVDTSGDDTSGDGERSTRVERGRYTREQGDAGSAPPTGVYRLDPVGPAEPRRYVVSEDGTRLRPLDESGQPDSSEEWVRVRGGEPSSAP